MPHVFVDGSFVQVHAKKIEQRPSTAVQKRHRVSEYTKFLLKLEQEAGSEANHKAYCDSEKAKNEAKRDDRSAKLDKYTTRHDKANAESDQLKQDVAKLTGQIADQDAAFEAATLALLTRLFGLPTSDADGAPCVRYAGGTAPLAALQELTLDLKDCKQLANVDGLQGFAGMAALQTDRKSVV